VTGYGVPSTGQKIPVQPGWHLPPQKVLLAKNKLLQAGKGAENSKEKFQQCSTDSHESYNTRILISFTSCTSFPAVLYRFS
jgi:hypothetical protein